MCDFREREAVGGKTYLGPNPDLERFNTEQVPNLRLYFELDRSYNN